MWDQITAQHFTSDSATVVRDERALFSMISASEVLPIQVIYLTALPGHAHPLSPPVGTDDKVPEGSDYVLLVFLYPVLGRVPHTEPTLNDYLLSKYIICNNSNSDQHYHNGQHFFNAYCVQVLC